MVDLKSLNAELASISGTLNYEALMPKVFEAQKKLGAATTSVLGTTIDNVEAGFTSLTEKAGRDFLSVKDALPGGIAMLTENPSGIEIKKPVSSLNNALEAITEDTVEGGFLNIDVTLGTPKAIAASISRITDIPVPQLGSVIKDLIPSELSELQGQVSNVLAEVQKGVTFAQNIEGAIGEFKSKLLNQIKGTLLSDLENIAGGLAGNVTPLVTPVKNITPSTALDPATNDVTFVTSQAEVQAILASAQREITTVVVGMTKSFKDIDARPSDNTQNWHFLINQDGELQQGCPIDTLGQYTTSYNEFTVGVAFMGGVQLNRGQARDRQDVEQHVSSAALTRAQWNTFDKVMRQFYAIFPHGQALGVADIEPEKTIAPGFDVPDYVRQRFGKRTIIDPADGPMSMKALQTKMATAAEKLVDPKINDEPGEEG